MHMADWIRKLDDFIRISDREILTHAGEDFARDGENTPFPWQEELFARFVSGTIERALDIPTGLGKTAVMAIWLVARACGAKLPRRLVYVVDRRLTVQPLGGETELADELAARNFRG